MKKLLFTVKIDYKNTVYLVPERKIHSGIILNSKF